MKRPRYVKPGDSRSPMLRLLQDCIHGPDGLVEVNYDAQWRTIFKAQRLGLVDSDCKITEVGRRWLAERDTVKLDAERRRLGDSPPEAVHSEIR